MDISNYILNIGIYGHIISLYNDYINGSYLYIKLPK